MKNKDIIDRARKYLESGESVDSEELGFEEMDPVVLAKWAVTVLELVTTRTKINLWPVENLRSVASDPARWAEAHDAFSEIREVVQELYRLQSLTREQQFLLGQLCLYENVARVVYNATNPVDPFDDDSGWWVLVCLKDVLGSLGDDAFSSEAWKVFSEGENGLAH